MFDAKSILENIVRGAAQSGSTPQSGGGSLGDILNEIGKSLSQGQTSPGQAPQGQTPAGAAPNGGGNPGGSIGDILGDLARKLGQPSTSGPGAGSSAPQSAGPDLGNILAQLKDKLNQAGGSVTDGGSITDILGKVLGQATEGVREGSSKIGEATGASDAWGRLASDPKTADVLGKLKDLVQNNPFAAGAAAGGLGGLVLGTETGRALAGGAAKIGAIAMIGGLAYKAVQNYQASKPLITGTTSTVPAPSGSGFEPAAVTNDAAIHSIPAMVAAAAADGRIDADEHDKIVGSLTQAGFDAEAETFLAKELNSPRTVQQLAGSVKSPQEGVQLYTAARIAITDNSPAEKQFLASLAAALGIDPKLAAHVDATAKAAA
jgi:uncharacterized membrane protein YebE (DUF533 family)